MHQDVVTRRSVCSWLGRAALLGLATLLMASSSPECARTADSTLGLSASGQYNHAEGCRESCLDAAYQARVDERNRFLAVLKSCDSGECRKAEAKQHASIMRQIAADQAACVGGCHNQGEGQGGN
jgi:hypothetical protein